MSLNLKQLCHFIADKEKRNGSGCDIIDEPCYGKKYQWSDIGSHNPLLRLCYIPAPPLLKTSKRNLRLTIMRRTFHD